ncbi:unknown [Prevotella sp. CAG:1185]|nr:unknown [Prevotella sp. CAG:1185]
MSLSINLLRHFHISTSIVKKYYSAVYGAKVAELRCQTCPLITRKQCFYTPKSMLFASLSALIGKQMLITLY